MSLVIAQLTLPIMPPFWRYNNYFLQSNSRENLKANFKKILYTLGGLVGLLGIYTWSWITAAPRMAIPWSNA